MFSNILDIETISLDKLAHLLATPGRKHYILCVGPLNHGAYRIDRFASIFANRETIATINNKEYSYTSRNKRITCKANCFIHDGGSLNVSFDVSIKPMLQNGIQLSNDYDVEGWFRQFGLCERAVPFYKRLERCSDLKEDDSLYISPDINGEKTDIVLVRPGRGILILKILEGQPDINRVQQYSTQLHTLQGNLMRKHLEEVWGKIASNNNRVWGIVKMAILFPDCSCEQIYNWLEGLKAKSADNLKIEYANNRPCGMNYVRFVGNDALTNTPGVRLKPKFRCIIFSKSVKFAA